MAAMGLALKMKLKQAPWCLMLLHQSPQSWVVPQVMTSSWFPFSTSSVCSRDRCSWRTLHLCG